jgi:malate synthase
VHYPKGVLNDGRKVTAELVRNTIQEELETIRRQVGDSTYSAGNYTLAAKLLDKITTQEQFEEFLTLVGYDYLP